MSESPDSAMVKENGGDMFPVVSFCIYMVLGFCITLSLYEYLSFDRGLFDPANNGRLVLALALSSFVGSIAASTKLLASQNRRAAGSETSALVAGIVSLVFGALFAVPVFVLLVLYIMYR